MHYKYFAIKNFKMQQSHRMCALDFISCHSYMQTFSFINFLKGTIKTSVLLFIFVQGHFKTSLTFC